MSKESEIALDLRRYNTPEKLSSLIFDTASLAIEASESDIARVNPSYFIKRGEDYVIAPGRDKRDVMQMFQASDPATDAAKKIKEFLFDDWQNDAYVWISPSNPWPETRLQVGVKKTTKSGRFEYLKRYDISTTLSPEQCLYLGQMLVSMSTVEMEFPQKPDDLRNVIIKLRTPADREPFEYLSTLIDLPEKDRWQSILDGSADKNKANAVKAAQIATEPVRLNPHVIYSAPKEYGAWVETRMRHEGYGMNPERFGCGGSNITIVNSSSNSETTTPLPIFTEGESWHSGVCRICGVSTLVGPCSICHSCDTKL
jgi:hypothetical protein